MPVATFNHPLFGLVEFQTAHSTWVRGDSITFLRGFDPADVKAVVIPQLIGIPSDSQGNGRKDGVYKVHKRARAQFLMVFAELERLDLMRHVRSCAGSFNMRLQKPTSGKLSKKPSNHSFGIAIDLNSDDGSNGGSVAPVAPVFRSLGFRWGIEFDDPMHFEVQTFIDHPRPVSKPATVIRGGIALDLGALNMDGHVLVELDKAQRVFGFLIIQSTAASTDISYQSRKAKIHTRTIGETRFAPLAEVSAIVGLYLSWDNNSKTATLS